jgi:tyrosinase
MMGASTGTRSWSRRLFLKGSGLTSVSLFVGSGATVDDCGDAIARRPVRRNVAELDDYDDTLRAYREAVRAMRALPETDPRNWTRQARLHQDHCPHGNWLFLPWHRAYLFYFERICRKLSGFPGFALPYWDWSTLPSVPGAFWGDESNPLFYSPRRAGPSTVANPSVVGPPRLATILDEPNFLVFASGRIEASDDQRAWGGIGPFESGPHNYIHGFVGGTMGNFMSPLDPIFWLHHNMIERCWVDWNLVRYHDNTNDPAWTGRTFTEFCDEEGNPTTVAVAELLLLPLLAYQYDQPIGAPPPSAAPAGDPVERVQAGAPVELIVRERFPAAGAVETTLDQPAQVPVPVPLDRIELVAGGGARCLLTLDGVTLGHTEDFHVHVFVNEPAPQPDRPATQPTFAGTFAFFAHTAEHPGHAGHPDVTTARYVLDLTEVLRRLPPTADPQVTLLLVPFPDRAPATRTLQVAALELTLVDARPG